MAREGLFTDTLALAKTVCETMDGGRVTVDVVERWLSRLQLSHAELRASFFFCPGSKAYITHMSHLDVGINTTDDGLCELEVD